MGNPAPREFSRFEWDENKRLENIRRHRIDFRDVRNVFKAPMLNRLDDRVDYGEDRWVGLGTLGKGIVVVVYTEREEEMIRIISARKANRHEHIRFHQELHDGLGPFGGPDR